MSIEQYLENSLPFWMQLDENEKKHVLQSCTTVKYKKGTLLHHSEHECKGIMLVLSGQLRVYIISEEGREVTLFRVRAGEACVLSASCLMDSIIFEVMIDAVEATEEIMIPSSVLSGIMDAHPKAEVYLYKTMTERFSEVLWTMQQILFMGADKRVAVFLWDEMIKNDNTVICYTHDEIARLIGSAREVVTKMLKYFSQEEVVTLSRGKIEIINKDKLKKFCN